MAGQFWAHFKALSYKTLVLIKRKPKSTALQVIVPVLGVFLLLILNKVVTTTNAISATESINRTPTTLARFGKIPPPTTSPTYSPGPLLYTPSNPTTDAIMQRLALNEDLDPTLLQPVDSLMDGADVWFSKIWKDVPQALISFSMPNGNETSYFAYIPQSATNRYYYNGNGGLPYNDNAWNVGLKTVLSPGYVNIFPQFYSLQRALDEAIIQVKSSNNNVKLTVNFEAFPVVPPPKGKSQINANAAMILSSIAPLIIFTTLLIPFFVNVSTLMSEKVTGVIRAMRVIGLSEVAYWCSWGVGFIVPALLYTFLTVIMGIATGVSLFSKTNFFVMYIVLIFSTGSLNALACAVTAPWKRPRVAYGVAFFVMVLSLALGLVICIFSLVIAGMSDCDTPFFRASPTFTDFLLFDPRQNLKGLRIALFFFPPFHFFRILDVVSTTTAKYYFVSDSSDQPDVTLPGMHFGWSQFFDQRQVKTCDGDDTLVYHSMAPIENIGLMIMNIILYTTLSWYLVQVFDTGNGATKPWYFPFSLEYWGLARRDPIVEGDSIGRIQQESLRDKNVRLHKVSKTFKDSTALKEVSLQLNVGEVFCFLGHNGAGKSTTVNIISAQTEPTHGYCFVRGLNVNTDMDRIRPFMGLCPQDDILWPELSGQEHLYFYAMFRGIPRQFRLTEVMGLLNDVDLVEKSNKPAGTYSGGMKRRLSVAISCIGMPAIILLDEPTTGLDPLARRRVWSLVQKLKSIDRVVLLTTHSMEEADVLSDRIALLSKGTLRASGTPVFLKNRFGIGYHATLVSDQEKEQILQGLVRKELPSAEILDCSGGNLSLAIPKNKAGTHVPAFFRLVDANEANLVKEWGISNTTLEEVFLRISAQNKAVVENAAVDDDNDAVAMCKLCKINPAEDVIVMTTLGVPLLASKLVCSKCCPPPGGAARGGDGAAAAAAPLALPAPKSAAADDDNDMSRFQESDYHQPIAVSESHGDSATGANSSGLELLPPGSRPASMPPKPAEASTSLLSPSPAGYDAHSAAGGSAAPAIKVEFGEPRQMRALMGRAWALKLKQRKTNICQAIFPLLLLIILIVLRYTKVFSPTQDGNIMTKKQCQNSDYSPFCSFNTFLGQTGITDSGSNTRSVGWVNQTCYDYYFRTTRNYPCPAFNNINYQVFNNYGGNDLNTSANFWIEDDTVTKDFEYNVAKFLPVTNWDQVTYTMKDDIVGDMVTNQKNMRDAAPSFDHDKQAMNYLRSKFPNLAIDVNKDTSVSDALYDYTIKDYFGSQSSSGSVWGNVVYPPLPNMDSWMNNYDSGNGQAFFSPIVNSPIKHMIMMNTMHTSVLRRETGNRHAHLGAGVVQTVPTPTYIKGEDNGSAVQFLAAMSALLYTFATIYLFPSFVQAVVTEREEKAIEMMRIMGVSMVKYWLSFYLFNMGQGMVVVLIKVIFCLAMKIAPIGGSLVMDGHSTAFQSILLLVMWLHCVVGLAALFSAAFSKGRSAVLVSYIFIILSTVGGVVLIATTLDSMPTAANLFLPFAFMFGWARVVMQISNGYVEAAFLFLGGNVLLVLGYVLHELASEESDLRRWIFNVRHASVRRDGLAADSERLISDEADEDVLEERIRVANNPSRYNIAVRDLGVAFGNFNAVKTLSFGVESNVCFGLLGPNGAGKTTAVSVIHGALKPTRGTVHVCSYDVTRDLSRIRRLMGVTPQFDCLFGELTAQEHLLFYARLQGVTPLSERACVQNAAEMVELDGDSFNKISSTLSGGQRRMLSLGISFIHQPQVILMDEPTTGLDPEMRRTAWRVISKMVKGRSIILTTHSMEEAEALCTRIGIMVGGSLRCLGNQLHLKSKYGTGYKLTIVATNTTGPKGQTACDRVSEFLREKAPQGKVVNVIANNTFTYQIPKGSVRISELFEAIGAPENQWFIGEWSFAQASLEDVFIKIAEESVDTRMDKLIENRA